jgi:hypothetical protein
MRKLAAIVAADAVGFSRLMGHDESGTVAASENAGYARSTGREK